jgi:hypothetical protein
MSKHPVDEPTEGYCRFCADKEYPKTIEFSCGWCGRKKVFTLVEETNQEIRNHIEAIAGILGIESEDVLNALLLMLESDEQQELIEALCDAYYSTKAETATLTGLAAVPSVAGS